MSGLGVRRGMPVEEDASVGGAEVSALVRAVPARAPDGRRVYDAPLLVLELVPARVGVGEVLDTGAVRGHTVSVSHAAVVFRCGLVRVRGVGWFGARAFGSGNERALTGAERTRTEPGWGLGSVRVQGGRMFTGA